MMKKDYTLEQIQYLIRDSNTRMAPKHLLWKTLERVLATGSAEPTAIEGMGFSGPGQVQLVRTVNVCLPHMTLIENSIISDSPQFTVWASSAGDMANPSPEQLEDIASKESIAGACLSHFWFRTNANRETADAKRNAIRIGKGFVKVAWSSMYESFTLTDEESALETIDLIDAAAEVAAENGVELPSIEEFEQEAAANATGELRVANEPFLAYVSPYNIRVPHTARYLDDAEWVAEKIVLRKDFVEDNEMYKPFFKAGGELQNTSLANGAVPTSSDSAESEKYFEEVEIWEFYDLINHRMVHLQLDGDMPLLDSDIPWSHRKPPYAEYNNYSVNPDDFWGFGELDNIAAIQIQIGEIVRAQLADVKRAGNKYWLKKQYVTPEIVELLNKDRSDIVIPIALTGADSLQDVMMNVPRQGAPAEVWEMKIILENDIRTQLGLNEFQTGGGGADRKSATEVAAIDGSGTIRIQDKIRSADRGDAQAAQLLLLLCQEFLDEETLIRIGGPEAGTLFKLEPGDIDGDMAVRVEAGISTSSNPAVQAKRSMELLELMPLILENAQNPAARPMLVTILRGLGHNPDGLLPPLQPAAPAQPAGPGGIPLAPLTGAPEQPAGFPADLSMTAPQNPVEFIDQMGGPDVPAGNLGDIAL